MRNYKMRTMISLLLMLMCMHCIDCAAQKNNWANCNRYAEANRTLPDIRPKEKRVVFMGNSITEGWVGTHPSFFERHGYIGRGISGQTSSHFVARFREDVINLKPKLVIINAGTNDIAENDGTYNEDYTMGNIMTMVELAQAHKIKVILTSVLPASRFGWNLKVTDSTDKILRLNNRIRAYARARRLPYVDYYKEMVYGSEDSLNPAYSVDGVHPNVAGYEVMEQLIQPIIEKVLK